MFEAVDHAKAYDFMFSAFRDRRIDEQTVLKMHGLFYRNIEPEYAGRYRDVRVLITGSQYPVAAPEKIQKEMDGLFAWVQKERGGYHPVEFAAQLHKRFVFIHPFKNGNGRVARLLMNLALIQDGYLPAIVPPILRGIMCPCWSGHTGMTGISWNSLQSGSMSPRRRCCGCSRSRSPGRGRKVSSPPRYSKAINRRKRF